MYEQHGDNNNEPSSPSESAEQYKKRWTSIRIVYFTMLFDSLSFSLVLASLWPYLQKVNKGQPLNPIYLGWANVGFHISGIVVDFIMGVWTNKRGSMEPLLVSLVIFACGNFLYSYAESCGDYGVTVVIVSRGIIGLSTGVNVIARAAISDATTLGERTTALAHMSLAEGVGFTFGPAVQLLSIPLGDDGIYLPSLKLNLNLYTAPAFICTFVAFINILLILGYYYEYCINIYKDMQADSDAASFRRLLDQSRGSWNIRFDHVAVVIVLFLYFVAQSAFALYEIILPPLTMDMLAWTRMQTAMYASILFVCAGIIAIFAFAASEILEKKSSDKLILLLGFAFIFLGYAIHLPWGDTYPQLKDLTNRTENSTGLSDATGCPVDEYSWCTTSPKIYIHQIIFGTVFLSVGYPFVMVLTSSMYSKILGPSPQGVMQSWFGATGGVARIVSPLLVTYLYANFGPRWTFVSIDSLVVFAIIILLLTHRRLIPYHLFVLHGNKDKQLLTDPNEPPDILGTPGNSNGPSSW